MLLPLRRDHQRIAHRDPGPSGVTQQGHRGGQVPIRGRRVEHGQHRCGADEQLGGSSALTRVGDAGGGQASDTCRYCSAAIMPRPADAASRRATVRCSSRWRSVANRLWAASCTRSWRNRTAGGPCLLIDQQPILQGGDQVLVQGCGAPAAGDPQHVDVHLTPQAGHDLEQVAGGSGQPVNAGRQQVNDLALPDEPANRGGIPAPASFGPATSAPSRRSALTNSTVSKGLPPLLAPTASASSAASPGGRRSISDKSRPRSAGGRFVSRSVAGAASNRCQRARAAVSG